MKRTEKSREIMKKHEKKEAKSLQKENEAQLLEENYVETMTIALNVKYRQKHAFQSKYSLAAHGLFVIFLFAIKTL